MGSIFWGGCFSEDLVRETAGETRGDRGRDQRLKPSGINHGITSRTQMATTTQATYGSDGWSLLPFIFIFIFIFISTYLYIIFCKQQNSLAGEDFIASLTRHGTNPYFIAEGLSYISLFNIAVQWPIKKFLYYIHAANWLYKTVVTLNCGCRLMYFSCRWVERDRVRS